MCVVVISLISGLPGVFLGGCIFPLPKPVFDCSGHQWLRMCVDIKSGRPPVLVLITLFLVIWCGR